MKSSYDIDKLESILLLNDNGDDGGDSLINNNPKVKIETNNIDASDLDNQQTVLFDLENFFLLKNNNKNEQDDDMSSRSLITKSKRSPDCSPPPPTTTKTDVTTNFSSIQLCYIEIPISSTDTLHSLSMKFGVSIINLKRINSLHNERDMFALKLFKVPIKPYSMLADEYKDKLKFADINLTRLNSIGRLDIDRDDYYKNDLQDKDASDYESDYADMGIVNESFLNEYTKTKDENNDVDIDLAEDPNSIKLSLLSNKISGESTLPKTSTTTATTKKKIKKDEAQNYFKKLDSNMKIFKENTNELVLNSIQDTPGTSESLIQIADLSYTVERGSFNNQRLNHLNNYNDSYKCISWRDLMGISCMIIILIPITYLIYHYYSKLGK
jgi:hypothetical protein